jgi:hypothetical protein
MDNCEPANGIPQPIVTLNRSLLLGGIALGFVLQQPLLTTALLALLLPAVLFGRRGSPVFAVGRRLLAPWNARAVARGQVEDPRLMRFNNGIAVALLGLAQVAFLAGQPTVGWVCALMVAAAAAVALAGFCLGCFLYYQLQQGRRRLLSRG